MIVFQVWLELLKYAECETLVVVVCVLVSDSGEEILLPGFSVLNVAGDLLWCATPPPPQQHTVYTLMNNLRLRTGVVLHLNVETSLLDGPAQAGHSSFSHLDALKDSACLALLHLPKCVQTMLSCFEDFLSRGALNSSPNEFTLVSICH